MAENTEIRETENTEETKGTEKKTEQEKKAELEKLKKTAEMAVQVASRGTMPLATPLQDGDRIVKELKYDFQKLTGMEMADALDQYYEAGANQFEITKKQALSLFAAAAGKEDNGLFAKEIAERIGPRDAINAFRIASLFFVASVRAASFLTTKE